MQNSKKKRPKSFLDILQIHHGRPILGQRQMIVVFSPCTVSDRLFIAILYSMDMIPNIIAMTLKPMIRIGIKFI